MRSASASTAPTVVGAYARRLARACFGPRGTGLLAARVAVRLIARVRSGWGRRPGRRPTGARALPLVAAGATALGVAASTAAATAAAAVLGRPHLWRRDAIQ